MCVIKFIYLLGGYVLTKSTLFNFINFTYRNANSSPHYKQLEKKKTKLCIIKVNVNGVPSKIF